MEMFLILMHLVLLPLIFSLFKYLRMEEIFKRHTNPNVIVLIYLILTVVVTQLVISYFTNVFDLIEAIF